MALSFDVTSALAGWAGLTLRAIDDQRAGLPGWLRRSADRADFPRAKEQFTRRDEYDFTYRTEYAGECKRGAGAAGGAARSVDRWESFRLIYKERKEEQLGGEAAAWKTAGDCFADLGFESAGALLEGTAVALDVRSHPPRRGCAVPVARARARAQARVG